MIYLIDNLLLLLVFMDFCKVIQVKNFHIKKYLEKLKL